ncbi:MAG: LPS export ABC transporter permease LptF [Deltaproteobacteria bacterium]|nr:LPS export ABC transporter permease LptF [Deltaproteobacteria bacterium]
MNGYIIQETFFPFIISLAFFSFIFLMTRILEITDLIVNYKIAVSMVLLLLFYSIPYFLVFVIPISVMTSIILTFLKMSKNNEIIALNSCGISIYRLIMPVAVFSVLGALFTYYAIAYAMPWGRVSFKNTVYEIAASNISVALTERTFNDSFNDVMLYVNKIDKKSGELSDIFIEDKRTKNIISSVIAPKGELLIEKNKKVFHIKLYDGVINYTDINNNTAHSIRFADYDIRLNAKKMGADKLVKRKKIKEMGLRELFFNLNKSKDKKDTFYYSLLIEIHKKFALPFACIALGLLAIPLGIQAKNIKKSFGVAGGLLVFILYYLLLSAGVVFGEAGIYPPALGMWTPNFIAVCIGVCLLIKISGTGLIKKDQKKKIV